MKKKGTTLDAESISKLLEMRMSGSHSSLITGIARI